MDRKIPRACFVIALILASFLLVPASNAEARETPRAAMRAGTNWLGSALTWLNDVLGERFERGRDRRVFSAVAKTEDGGDENSVTGICIDPMGRPRPCPGD